MRGIKFRAWDKGNKEMIYQSENTTKQNGIMEAQFTFDEMGAWIFTRNYGEQACNEVKNFELMQYTGLKDKNGKEIYEGDIVNWNDKYIGAIEWNTRMSGYYFMRNGSGFQFHEQQQINPKHGGLLHVEVIGNVFENPELIEKAQA
jgi:uncharacterized phage protein (TIGR01671 family)